MTSLHLMISGNVQGVGFRAWIRHKAILHGLTGWVRNRDDGAVELVASGTKSHLTALIAHAKIGPPLGRVDDVVITWLANEAVFSDFKVVH